MSITPETLAWLRQCAALDGAAYPQVLLHLLDRVEVLEAAQQQLHQDKLDLLIALDRREPMQQPIPEAAPVATDEKLPTDGDSSQPANYIDPEHQGETLELLQTFYQACNAEGGTADEIYLRGIRAVATLLQQPSAPAPAMVPVAVSERPWEKGGWTDLDGECWWCPPDGPAYWSMANPAMVYGGWLLPAHAIPLPQAEEVEG